MPSICLDAAHNQLLNLLLVNLAVHPHLTSNCRIALINVIIQLNKWAELLCSVIRSHYNTLRLLRT